MVTKTTPLHIIKEKARLKARKVEYSIVVCLVLLSCFCVVSACIIVADTCMSAFTLVIFFMSDV